MLLEQMEHEVRNSIICQIATHKLPGVTRKQLGLSFLGETRKTEQFVIADVNLTGIKIDNEVNGFQ